MHATVAGRLCALKGLLGERAGAVADIQRQLEPGRPAGACIGDEQAAGGAQPADAEDYVWRGRALRGLRVRRAAG